MVWTMVETMRDGFLLTNLGFRDCNIDILDGSVHMVVLVGFRGGWQFLLPVYVVTCKVVVLVTQPGMELGGCIQPIQIRPAE